MSNDVTPTITLAKLYESQDQHLDAFLVYQKLNNENPSGEIADKMKDLQEKIFSNIRSEYNEVISKIFTPEERKKFRILPHEDYLEMTKVEDDSEDISDITENLQDEDTSLLNGDKKEEIDLSDLSNGVRTDLDLNSSREIETESVDVLDQSIDNFSSPVNNDNEPTENESEEQIRNPELEQEKEDVSSTEKDELPLKSILDEMQSIDADDFNKYLKDKEDIDIDPGELKLSQLQEILRRYRNEK
jgi:hypothetical protein